MKKIPNKFRRQFLSLLGLSGLVLASKPAEAHHTESHFDDNSEHKIVYQCNKADNEYYGHVLFSVSEMLRKYGDNIEIIIAAFGPGIQLLGKHPTRPVDADHQQKLKALAAYGVAVHACGNTMDTLKWSKQDIVEYAQIVPIGVDDLMQLQEQGFSYISW